MSTTKNTGFYYGPSIAMSASKHFKCQLQGKEKSAIETWKTPAKFKGDKLLNRHTISLVFKDSGNV